MAENLKERGLDVTLVEFTDQLVASLDADMAAFLHQHLRLKGLKLLFRTGAAGFAVNPAGQLQVRLTNGRTLPADLVIFSVGINPDSHLAKDAGLELGLNGSIKVDRYLYTSDPDILAVGDAIQIENFVTGQPGLIPLAGPANKQGRIAADNIAGRKVPFEGVQGSAVLKAFDMTAASTGLNEKQLKRDQIPYAKTYIHPLDHAGYYPGATQLSLKLLFDPASGKILGAQAVGINGVEKRIDVLATAQRLGATVMDLEKLELTYAPPYSSAKDPVNMLGYTATNILSGDTAVFHYHDIAGFDLEDKDLLVDVRTPEEFDLGSIPGAINIPLDELRGRLAGLSRERRIHIFCQVGLRGYLATRILRQNGFASADNLSGGYKLYHAVMLEIADNQLLPPERTDMPFTCTGEPRLPEEQLPAEEGEGEKLAVPPVQAQTAAPAESRTMRLDATGLQCPGPILKLAEGIKQIAPGDRLVLDATDPGFVNDAGVWCERTGHVLENLAQKNGVYTATIRKGEPRQPAAATAAGNDKTMIVFSGDLDKAIATFIIANGAASMGRKVTLFFTFWGLNILRRGQRVKVSKNFIEKMFGLMMPRGSRRLGLSRLNMGGAGTKLIRSIMKKKNISSLEEMIQVSLQTGVRLVACQMTMDMMGIKPEELIDGVEIGGVASMLGSAEQSDMSLFI
ncbi:MAG TPA: pyridine nucleotide-disulfide oxidoreductase [Clostridiales bacterium]|nr:pyridine nucleotide-disulfide oxidoreductase [Clostridiales bacterium]